MKKGKRKGELPVWFWVVCMTAGGWGSVAASRACTQPFYVEMEGEGISQKDVIRVMAELKKLTGRIPRAEQSVVPAVIVIDGKEEGPELDLDAVKKETDRPDRLNSAFYYMDSQPSHDNSQSVAGKVYQVLEKRDSVWIQELYGLGHLSPQEMARRLGVEVPSVSEWNHINVRFRNGDGAPISGYSNAKEILSLASVYGYYHQWEDLDSFQDYGDKLWKASHSYGVSISDIYYCVGDCQYIEDSERENAQSSVQNSDEGDSSSAGSSLGSAGQAESGETMSFGRGAGVQENGPGTGEAGSQESSQSGEGVGGRESGQSVAGTVGQESGQSVESAGGQESSQPGEGAGSQESSQSVASAGDQESGQSTEGAGGAESGQMAAESVGSQESSQSTEGAGGWESGQPGEGVGGQESSQPVENVEGQENGQPADDTGIHENSQPADNAGSQESAQAVNDAGGHGRGQMDGNTDGRSFGKEEGVWKRCLGHVDLNISAQIIGLDENRNLCMADTTGNKPEPELEQWNGWDETTQFYARTIEEQDWYGLYGITSSVSMYVRNPLSASEVAFYLNLLPEGTSQKRWEVVRQALLSVGSIPYYWGGKPSHSGFEGNGFGSLVFPDEDGRNLRGLDCSGWINWVYWTALGSPLSSESTSGLISCGRGITKDELQAGDILVRIGESNHVYMFLAWAGNGSMYLIHETTGTVNNVTIDIYDLELPYYRSLINEE
ncbi:MAG: hypothetical protein HFG70_12720 [Hungatella sp.]|nr:hypothetical protein [Hungatella sp.]